MMICFVCYQNDNELKQGQVSRIVADNGYDDGTMLCLLSDDNELKQGQVSRIVADDDFDDGFIVVRNDNELKLGA